MRLALFILALSLLAGCNTKPQRGGRSTLQTPAATVTVDAPENPNTPTTQRTEIASEAIARIPISSLALASVALALPTNTPATERQRLISQLRADLAALESSGALAPVIVTQRTSTAHQTSLGSSWQDTARLVGAKMRAALPLLLAGIAFIAGGGALAYFGWWTNAVIAWASGLACVALFFMLPQITGTQWMLIGLGLLLAGGAVLAITYAYRKGELDAAGRGD